MKATMAPMNVMEKHKVRVLVDRYLNDPERTDEMKKYCDPVPADLNTHFVPLDKSDSNLNKIEESIQEDFSL